jgi:hypothetical protein
MAAATARAMVWGQHGHHTHMCAERERMVTPLPTRGGAAAGTGHNEDVGTARH